MNLELSVFNFIHNLAGQSVVLDWLVIFLGSYLGYFLLAGFVLMLFREKDWRARFYYCAFAVLAVILSRGLLTEIIRFFSDRPRPFAVLSFEPLINHTAAAALPSGHAAFYIALALSVFLISKKWGWVYLFAALITGLARVIAGVHWPLDIAAGALVAALSFFVIKWALERFRPR